MEKTDPRRARQLQSFARRGKNQNHSHKEGGRER